MTKLAQLVTILGTSLPTANSQQLLASHQVKTTLAHPNIFNMFSYLKHQCVNMLLLMMKLAQLVTILGTSLPTANSQQLLASHQVKTTLAHPNIFNMFSYLKHQCVNMLLLMMKLAQLVTILGTSLPTANSQQLLASHQVKMASISSVDYELLNCLLKGCNTRNMTEMFTWDCTQWLEENFFKNNGLPHFFIQGKYTYTNKAVAIKEYKEAVNLGVKSENVSYSRWSNMMVNIDFSVIQNSDVTNFWRGMLETERRDSNLNQYTEMTFINQTQEQYTNRPLPVKRKSIEKATSSVVGIEINTFEETDSVHVEGMEETIATWIGRDGRITAVTDRKSRYFNALGMNGILDLSDTSEGSQLSKFSVDTQNKIRQLFSLPHITTPYIEQRFEEIQNELCHTTIENGRYLKRYLEKLDMFKSKEKYSISKKLHTIILELMLYDSYIFDPKDSKFLSEGDYVVKVWGPLLENLFRGSGSVLHWGDTVPDNIKAVGRTIKMDLRIINSLGDERVMPDFATGEISKSVLKSKFYQDKLKTVLTSKMDLNQFVESSLKFYADTPSIYIPFFIITELEATVCVLYLGSNGLYVINEVTTISLPTTSLEVKDGAVLSAISKLNMMKKLVADIRQLNTNIADLEKVKKRKTVKALTGSQINNDKDEVNFKEWIRPVWFPPKFERDSDDA
ncbi:hypothetical protein K501DRAFT_330694 [Backusella circina FSU 941]|nr:hypothetical protein K501DRAFT_330694 [Backusella circina FSU 941]